VSLIEDRRSTHGDPWTTALAYNPEDPLAYPRDMKRAKLARIQSGGLHTEHIVDLYEYDIMEQDFTTRLERQGK
tara:strand:+ start:1709 stop:1930 length:222 start_codon:yes stop_codon:yes gene_type:complete